MEKMVEEMVLECAIYREATVFPVKIARNAKVSALQEAIAGVVSTEQHAVPPRLVTLYLAKKNGTWLKDDDKLRDFLGGAIDKEYKEMRPSWKINKSVYFGDGKLGEEEIHVLVELPPEAAAGGERTEQGKWSARDLSTVDPDVQLNVWKSVVRVSSDDVCSGTALVVDRTATHVYLLTNLHLWVDEVFAGHLSDDFKAEIKRYSRLHPGMKASGKRQQNRAASSAPRKSARTLNRKAPVFSDKPEIVIEQLQASGKRMEEVLKFRLGSDICWRSSAAFDFAIFEVAVTSKIGLVRCRMAIDVHPTMRVHVFGFPGALQDRAFGYPYAIIPAQVTGWSLNQMTLSSLSAPGLSGSAIVCTVRGVPVGYIGGGFDGSAENEQYQSNGFTLHGIPPDLPSLLPPEAEDETKEEQ